jgi:hypothetical protein
LSSYRIFYDARYPDGDPAFLALPVLIERIRIIGGVTVFRINDKQSDLNYNVVTSAIFSGQTQNTAIVGVVVNNPAQKELEDIRVIIPLGNAKLAEPKIIGLQPGSYSQAIDTKQVEIQVPYLNPKESFSIQLLLALSSPSWNVNNSSISVRGKGVTAALASSVPQNKGFLEFSGTAVAALLSVIILTVARSSSLFNTKKHVDDQRDVVAYILGVHGFYQEATQMRALEREISYWSLADSVTEKCLESSNSDFVQRGIRCLTSLLSYAEIEQSSQLLINYDLARLAANAGDLKLAKGYLELAQKGNHPVINMRIAFDRNLSQID